MTTDSRHKDNCSTLGLTPEQWREFIKSLRWRGPMHNFQVPPVGTTEPDISGNGNDLVVEGEIAEEPK